MPYNKANLRKDYNKWGGIIGVVLAALSLIFALVPLLRTFVIVHFPQKIFEYIIVGFWVLVPPMFFWFDWVVLCPYLHLGDTELEQVAHTHELSRNIWLAVIVLLGATFGLGWPGAGQQ
jgi:hypothetical protein